MNTDDAIYPKFFTTEEGGTWLPCPKGYCLSKETLDYHNIYAVQVRYKNKNYRVHSLAFEGIESDKHSFPRWDEINGWTAPL